MNTRERAIFSWLISFVAGVGFALFRPFPIPDFDQLAHNPTLKDLTLLCTGFGLACLVVAVLSFILGVWWFFQGITQETRDEDEGADFDATDPDPKNDDHGNGQHRWPPNFSNN